MRRDRAVRACAGLLASGAAAIGLVAATSDALMLGGRVASMVFALAGLAGIVVALGALLSPRGRRVGTFAAGAGVLTALAALVLVPFTSARSLCACTDPSVDLLPPVPSLGGAAPHDVLLGAAIAVPLALLAAANVGRRERRTGLDAEADDPAALAASITPSGDETREPDAG